MNMRERIARAINPLAWIIEEHVKQREESFAAADRVLAAMFGPTDEMIWAGDEAETVEGYSIGYSAAETAWNKMLGAAHK